MATDAAYAALGNGERFELIEWLGAVGPSTATEIAEYTGRTVEAVERDLALMCEAGLFHRVAALPSECGVGYWYDVVAERITFDVDWATGWRTREMSLVLEATLEATRRRMRRETSSGELSTQGETRSLWARMETTWLTDDARRRVNMCLYEIEQIVSEGRERREGQPFSLSLYMMPTRMPVSRDDGAPPTNDTVVAESGCEDPA